MIRAACAFAAVLSFGCRWEDRSECPEIPAADFSEGVIGGEWSMRVDWLSEEREFYAKTECVGLPPLGVYSTKEGEHDIDEIQFGLTDRDGQRWVTELPDARLRIEVDGKAISTSMPAWATCGGGECSTVWIADVSDSDLFVSPDNAEVFRFTLLAWEDERSLSNIDALWDGDVDNLQLVAYAVGHGCCLAGNDIPMFVSPP